MDLNGFKKMSEQDKENIVGAGFLTSFMGFLPAIVNGIASIAGSIKVLGSSSGEIKTKDISQKWDNSQPKDNSKITPIYFVY